MKKTFIIILTFFTFSLFGQSFVQNSMMMRPKGDTAIYGLLNFDGVNDYVLLDTSVNITGSKMITFNMNLRAFDDKALFTFIGASSSDHLSVYITSDSLLIPYRGSSDQENYNFKSYLNKNVYVEIVKGTSSIESISFNGVTQTSNSVVSGLNKLTSWPSLIGGMYNGGYYTSNVLIWDIKIYDDPSGENTLINNWLGYPDGNTDAAWEDQIGTIDGTVYGSPTTTDIIH